MLRRLSRSFEILSVVVGLKIIQVCFESELNAHWQRIARVIKEISKVAEARAAFWSYLDFLVAYRNPLFIILLPFLQQKVRIRVQFSFAEKFSAESLAESRRRWKVNSVLFKLRRSYSPR